MVESSRGNECSLPNSGSSCSNISGTEAGVVVSAVIVVVAVIVTIVSVIATE